MPRIRGPLLRWGLVLPAVAAVALLNALLVPMTGARALFLPFFPAILAVGYLAGFGPGLLAAFLSVLAVRGLWMEPRFSLAAPVHPTDLSALAMFVLAGGLSVAFAALARASMEEARATRQRLNMALAAGRMAAWEWQVGSGAIRFSEGAQAVFGTSWTRVEEAWPLAHPEDADMVKARVQAALASGTHYSFMSRIHRADTGKLRWVETHGSVHRDRQGRAWKVTGVTVDVTERQQALELSRAAEHRFQIALRGNQMIVWECDASLQYTWVYNPQAGLRVEDFIGRRVGDVLPREECPAYFDAVDRALATGQTQKVASQFHLGGQDRHYRSHIEATRDAQGRITGLIGASVDVTELRRTQEQLQREGARKDAFLAILAHELRNPMAPIRYAAALLRPDVSAEALSRARDIIQRQAGVMSRLLDDLLDMSRITRNAIRLKRDTLDLRQVIGQAVETVDTAMAERRHRLAQALPPLPVWVSGDAARLQQVLTNLLDNAIKYTDPEGDIRITLRETEAEAILAVSDSGLGLDETMRAEVFELFSQFHRVSGVDRGGLGIGLAVVKQLVELHGGEVSAHSDGPGQGSTFELRLPLVEPPEVAAALDGPDGAVRLHAGQQVLVVDDNQDAAETLSSLLRQQSLSVSVAHGGAQALRSFEALRPRAVLLDIGLPDMSGHEVAMAMKRMDPTVRIIAVSGWNQPDDRHRSALAGIDLHLVKPVDPAHVSDVVAQALKEASEKGGASA